MAKPPVTKKDKQGTSPLPETVSKFEAAVRATRHLADAYKPGLQALGEHSRHVEVPSDTQCEGSADIDKALFEAKQHLSNNRWDYCFSYNNKVYFVEVHSAHTGEVSTVLKKLQWLKDWLLEEGQEKINALKKANPPFIWIQSNGCHILKNAPQYRSLVVKGMMPVKQLILL